MGPGGNEHIVLYPFLVLENPQKIIKSIGGDSFGTRNLQLLASAQYAEIAKEVNDEIDVPVWSKFGITRWRFLLVTKLIQCLVNRMKEEGFLVLITQIPKGHSRT